MAVQNPYQAPNMTMIKENILSAADWSNIRHFQLPPCESAMLHQAAEQQNMTHQQLLETIINEYWQANFPVSCTLAIRRTKCCRQKL